MSGSSAVRSATHLSSSLLDSVMGYPDLHHFHRSRGELQELSSCNVLGLPLAQAWMGGLGLEKVNCTKSARSSFYLMEALTSDMQTYFRKLLKIILKSQ